MPKKAVRTFPNRKPCLNREIDSLLKDRSEAFKTDDPDLYKKSRFNLRKAKRDAKREYQTKLESQTGSRRLWQGLNNITGYKAKLSSISGSSALLPNELNVFYARFEQVTNNLLLSAPAAHNSPIPTITASEIRSAFWKVNLQKATGPDGILGHVLRACVEQLAEVFANIFNLSLLRSEVPTCFKKTTIIPVPKKNQAMCLNDYHPVALTSVVMKRFERLIMKRITSILPEQRTKNKEMYSTGTGPSALQARADHAARLNYNLLHFLGPYSSIPILFMYLSRCPLNVTIVPASTTSSGSEFQAPTTLCVKNLPRTSTLNLAPLTLNLCP
ncbi:uncharacterized protein [Scyliorhinus torazame]|uniref:uncharacterized protein n=1 Tax=Scyliorhinus torazame TaxID=75743 RepID=UPI003B5A4BF6